MDAFLLSLEVNLVKKSCVAYIYYVRIDNNIEGVGSWSRVWFQAANRLIYIKIHHTIVF